MYSEIFQRILHFNSWPFTNFLNTYLVGWLIEFYGISTVVGYSMPNSVYKFIDILFVNEQFVVSRWVFTAC